MPSEPISAHISPDTHLSPTIKAWRIYLNDQGNSPHTVKAFIHDLELFAAYITTERSVGTVSTADLNHFLDWLQKGRGVACSPKTLSRRITALKAFFRWLNKNGVIVIDPAEKVLQKSVLSPLPTVLTPEEVDQAMKACMDQLKAAKPDARTYALFYLLISCGIKKGECLTIKLNHIELDGADGPFLFVRYANPQNRYKERKISLPLDWLEVFQEYQQQYKLTDTLFPWSQRRLEYLLEDLSTAAGINKHISFDMCRWTCAVLDWKSDMERDKIRQKLGLSKVQWREISMKLERLAS